MAVMRGMELTVLPRVRGFGRVYGAGHFALELLERRILATAEHVTGAAAYLPVDPGLVVPLDPVESEREQGLVGPDGHVWFLDRWDMLNPLVRVNDDGTLSRFAAAGPGKATCSLELDAEGAFHVIGPDSNDVDLIDMRHGLLGTGAAVERGAQAGLHADGCVVC